MKVIYTSNYFRREVKDDIKYYNWLLSLNKEEQIGLQQFVPASNSIFSLGIEYWKLELVELRENRICNTEVHPINREKGWACWWDSKEPHGNVFPSRLVPLRKEYELTNLGDFVCLHKPIYEPLFLNKTRYVYLVPYGDNFPRRMYKLRELYPYNYSIEVDNGELVHCFTDSKVDIEEQGINFLYSNYERD